MPVSDRPHRTVTRPKTLTLLTICLLGVALGLVLAPADASAHGLVGRAYLPVPAWLFAWAAAGVLVASFAALAFAWRSPRLEAAGAHRVARLPGWTGGLLGVLGVAFFALLLVSGVVGSQLPTANLAPTAIFVLFWVGIPVLSVLVGDVFAALNPWRALARAGAAAWKRIRPNHPGAAPLSYPRALGRWPAVVGIFAFAWLELIYVGRDRPATLAVLAVAYACVQWVGMALFGIETWTARGDGFAVTFNLFSRLSVLEYRQRSLWRRPFLSGLTAVEPLPGTVALVCTIIGATTFDGLLNGPVWRSLAPSLQRDLGGGTAARELSFTLGLLASVALCGALYGLGVRGMGAISPDHRGRALARSFAHSLAPIAFGYLLAHYFSLLVTQGQATAYLISDPMGTGANLFGTAGTQIDYGLISAALIWYVQVAALIGGHVSGLALAHDRALVLYGDPAEAAASQRWMLAVMVSFTCLGLWLLSAVNT